VSSSFPSFLPSFLPTTHTGGLEKMGPDDEQTVGLCGFVLWCLSNMWFGLSWYSKVMNVRHNIDQHEQLGFLHFKFSGEMNRKRRLTKTEEHAFDP